MTVQVRALSLVTTLAAAVTIAACSDDDASGPNIPTETFRATLSGANERPNPVTSNGTGTAVVVLYANDSISYDVKIGSIDSVTLSHIHAGDVNTAGGIIYGFPNTVPPTSFGPLTQFQLGWIKRTSTFSGIFATAGFDSLVTRLRAGTAYVNVHTRRNGSGEIRGNLIKQ
jgi:hypothetical protein